MAYIYNVNPREKIDGQKAQTLPNLSNEKNYLWNVV